MRQPGVKEWHASAAVSESFFCVSDSQNEVAGHICVSVDPVAVSSWTQATQDFCFCSLTMFAVQELTKTLSLVLLSDRTSYPRPKNLSMGVIGAMALASAKTPRAVSRPNLAEIPLSDSLPEARNSRLPQQLLSTPRAVHNNTFTRTILNRGCSQSDCHQEEYESKRKD